MKPISARITDNLYQAIQDQVDAGTFASRSQAVAYYLQRGFDADANNHEALRQIVREELARVQLQPAGQPAQKTANPKRAAMLNKVVR